VPPTNARLWNEPAGMAVTERDLFNAHGTFYELPAKNAGGFVKVRPVATHNFRIHDYCSYRGLFILSQASVITRRPAIRTSSAPTTARRRSGPARLMMPGSSANRAAGAVRGRTRW
jgi:hypothetical protein